MKQSSAALLGVLVTVIIGTIIVIASQNGKNTAMPIQQIAISNSSNVVRSASLEIPTAAPVQSSASVSSLSQAISSVATIMNSIADGSYNSTVTYETPEEPVKITVTLTLKNGLVTYVGVTSDARGESREYVNRFENTYESQVMGRSISKLQLSRVAGASLTTDAFNSALEKIIAQAQG